MNRWQNVQWNIPTNISGNIDQGWVEVAIAMDIRDALLAIAEELRGLREAPPPPPVCPPLPLPPPRDFTDVRTTPIDELELSVRSYNALSHDSIRTVGDLITKTTSELLRTPNLGKVSLREIEQILHQLGLKLREETDHERRRAAGIIG
jgi:DNA-directed RNA polymerase alpha subunit